MYSRDILAEFASQIKAHCPEFTSEDQAKEYGDIARKISLRKYRSTLHDPLSVVGRPYMQKRTRFLSSLREVVQNFNYPHIRDRDVVVSQDAFIWTDIFAEEKIRFPLNWVSKVYSQNLAVIDHNLIVDFEPSDNFGSSSATYRVSYVPGGSDRKLVFREADGYAVSHLGVWAVGDTKSSAYQKSLSVTQKIFI